MQKEVQKTGGSLCVIIPSDIAEDMELQFKTKIDLQYKKSRGKKLIIKTVTQ